MFQIVEVSRLEKKKIEIVKVSTHRQNVRFYRESTYP